MSQNPYGPETQNFGQGPGVPAAASAYGDGLPPEPASTSVLAIVAFVVALISIVACCVPGLPLVGALLGVFAVIGIARSNGRKKGTGFAITAIVIGILMSIVQTIGLIVSNQGVGELTTLTQSLEEIEADNFDALRARLPNADASQLTDARLREFRDDYTASLGEHVGPSDSLMSLIGTYFEVGQSFQAMSQPDWPYPSNAIPLPSEFDNGTGLIVFVPDPNATSTVDNPMPLENIGILAPDGDVFWLIDPDAAGTGTPDQPVLAPIDEDALTEPAEGETETEGGG